MKRLFLLLGVYLTVSTASAQAPAYYQEHLAAKIKQINDKEQQIGASGEVFVFITDTHTGANQMTSPSLLKEISTKTSVERIVFGGDMVKAYGTEEHMYEQVLAQMNSYDSVLSPYAKLYNVFGNHDIMIRDRSDPDQTLVYASTHAARYGLIMKRQEPYVHFDDKNPHGGYFYFDNPTQKTRYIGLNAFERIVFTKNKWIDKLGVSPEQASWLIHSALQLPDDDWGVFVFIHCGIAEATYAGGYVNYSVTKNILEAFNTKQAYRFNGESGEYQHDLHADFSDGKGRLVAVFSGHMHKDLFGYTGSVPHIVTANDTQYSDDGIKRIVGTVDESCFDVVCYDKNAKLLSLVRVGAGFDRTIHLESTSVRVNASVTLTPIIDAVDWQVANSSIADVKDGVVTVKDKGEASVIAIDSVGNREYFNIRGCKLNCVK